MTELTTLFSIHMQQLCERFDEAMAHEGISALLLPSGEPKRQFLDDMDYPFVVNPQFKTWVPVINNPHCWIVYRLSEKPLLIFYQAEDFWHKPAILSDSFWRSFFEIQIIKRAEEAFKYLPENGTDAAIVGEWSEQYQGRLDQQRLNPQALLNRLNFGRCIKSEYEIACMQDANDKAALGHVAAAAAFRAGESELTIHLEFLRASEQMEQEVPYGNIVALNENAAILHYQHLQTRPRQNVKSFLIDAGASCRGYAADITRTYAAKNDQFATMIQAFDKLQKQLVQQLKPGLDYVELHCQAHQKIAHWMSEFNLLACSAESAYEQGVTQTFLPHGLGHFLGLQVHDVAGKQANIAGDMIPQPSAYPFLRLLRVLQQGHVVTIEPGFYFIPSLMSALKNSAAGKAVNWRNIETLTPYGGIRIEDDVVITEQGSLNLTGRAFAKVSA